MIDWKIEAIKLAEDKYPNEACGLVVIKKGRETFFPCINTSSDPMQTFVISAEEYAEAEDAGEISAIFHSHCNKSPSPSDADVASCEITKKPWYIYGLPSNTWFNFSPTGYKIPLIGREFTHGVLDCYAIVKDWYKIEKDIELMDMPRDDDWWHKGQNLYIDNFKKAGFVETDELEIGTVIFMQIGSPVANHAAVYIGDNQIIHHLYGRLSSRDVYGEMFRKVTVKMVKYAKRD